MSIDRRGFFEGHSACRLPNAALRLELPLLHALLLVLKKLLALLEACVVALCWRLVYVLF